MSDDVMYGLAMILSVAFGPIFRNIVQTPTLKRWISSGLGLTLLLYMCGYHLAHIIITIAGNCFLFLYYPPSQGKRLGWKSFMWNFGYLVIFRTVHVVGIPPPSPVTNAAQLFLVLRMVGLAFELQDSHDREKAKKKEDNQDADRDLQLQIKYCNIQVSVIDIILYSFCYIGLLTGPYFKYRTYQDWLHLPNNTKLNTKDPLLERIYKLPLIAITYLFFSYFFNIKYVETDEFLDHSFWFRLFYMVPMFTIFRTRLYLAWIMSECMSITAGLGAYPKDAKPKCGRGPTDYQQMDKVMSEDGDKGRKDYAERDFETIHNIDIYGCELAPRTRQGLRSWNMTIQYWLANHIHHRVPSYLKAYRVALTMGVSAFWHGIHPGYYLSFLTVPPILMAEEAMLKAFHKDASPQGQNIFDWGCWFFKMRGFDYNCMGFLLLGFNSTLRYWHSIYFMGHVVIVFFLLVGNIGIMLKPKQTRKQSDKQE